MTDNQLSEALPIRYRVSGMDCAKDAAQIERAAQTAGIAPNAVKVSAATHIMTLNVPEGRLPEIEKAVAVTGYGFDRIEGDEVLSDEFEPVSARTVALPLMPRRDRATRPERRHG
ncbi:heavy-metal-associated domain-containing protein [Seohaeicola saemankumensis]|uniref:Heavy-metal-associated domain-containing protein n=1 Tax=Seohaeicola saemankumensis TaxID=481181 RepID=A0ABW3TFD0_9RHOB